LTGQEHDTIGTNGFFHNDLCEVKTKAATTRESSASEWGRTPDHDFLKAGRTDRGQQRPCASAHGECLAAPRVELTHAHKGRILGTRDRQHPG
jgi:hypothetical protein